MDQIDHNNSYDLLVIGAGMGGYVAALHAAKNGLRTAIVEYDKIGGTCLNRGCIPTKQLLHESNFIKSIQDGLKEEVINGCSIQPNMDAIYNKVFESVDTLCSGVKILLRARGVSVIQGKASFIDKNTISVDNGSDLKTLKTKNTLIASGSVPVPFPGLDKRPEGVVYSDDLLEKKNPMMDRLIVIGAGVIGVELASVYTRLGTQVHIIELCKQILPNMDRKIAKKLQKCMEKEGINFHLCANVKSINKVIGCVRVGFEQNDELEYIEADRVLIAVGRKANTKYLGYENAGLELVDGGFDVNSNCQTAVEGIYAVGDVTTGSLQLAHAAAAQGMRAVDAILGNENAKDLPPIPCCVYTSPEIAVVGVDRRAAAEKGIEAVESVFPMAANGMSIIGRQTDGFIKIVSEKLTNKIIGAQLFCDRATDLVSELSVAIANEMTLEDINNTIHPHPSFSESIAEAAGIPLGRVIHVAK